ncbi:MAG: hypothetical protein WCK89_13875 [bacterium]
MSDSDDLDGQAPVFKDRKTGLVLFGILQIGLGSLCALMIPLMLVGMMLSKTIDNQAAPPTDVRMMIPALLFYVLIAVWFIWMGIGSVLARRWARALLVVTSWIWLISGIGGLLVMWLIMPDMYAQMAATGQMPQAVASLVMWVTFGFMLVFYVLLPGGLALFYGSKNVKATCEFRNPRPCWTDACPLPVLALSLLFTFWACSVVLTGFYGWVLPFFGFLLSGATGAAVAAATMALLAYVAWGSYRLDVKAWFCSVGVVVAWGLSICLTFARVSLMDFYAKMNFPEQQLELMRPICNTQGPMFAVFGALWFVALLGYLLYTRKYYPKA